MEPEDCSGPALGSNVGLAAAEEAGTADATALDSGAATPEDKVAESLETDAGDEVADAGASTVPVAVDLELAVLLLCLCFFP